MRILLVIVLALSSLGLCVACLDTTPYPLVETDAGEASDLDAGAGADGGEGP